jgi:hypothetical protein
VFISKSPFTIGNAPHPMITSSVVALLERYTNSNKIT